MAGTSVKLASDCPQAAIFRSRTGTAFMTGILLRFG